MNGAESTDQGGTLVDPRLTILDSNGDLIVNTDHVAPINFSLDDREFNVLYDTDSGSGNNPKIILGVSTTGTYYLEVAENGSNATGTYTIQVTALGEAP